MTTTTEANGSAAQAAATDTASATTTSGGIQRLHPVDGLFLRSEHLDQMQTYARELSLAGGVAGGTGVVAGFGLTLDGAVLHVAPGLAVDPSGRPLRSREQLSIPLDGLAIVPGRFWVVEVAAAGAQPAGSEPVYGELCADACSAGSIQPWLLDVVSVTVRADDTLPGLAATRDDQRRNWLASAWFEAERRAGGPWVAPDAAGNVVRLLDAAWSEPQPAAEPAPGAVPIGVLLRAGDSWQADVWTARRDLMTTPPASGWDWRLGWRPWPAFLAQVLQFEAQLSAAPFADTLGSRTVAGADDLYDVLLKNPPRSRRGLEEAWERWRRDKRPLEVAGQLSDRGFLELPAGGFLPRPSGDGELDSQLDDVFGRGISVTVRHAAADACLRALRDAQHLDRIPLGVSGGRIGVQVWVPDVSADLPALVTKNYGWVVFVRDRDEHPAAAQPDEVQVFVLELGDDDLDAAIDRLSKAPEADPDLQAPQPFAVLKYPPGSWAVPASPDGHRAIRDEVQRLANNGQPLIAAVATAATSGDASALARRPLAAARAELLGAEFASGPKVSWLPTWVLPSRRRESVWLVTHNVRIG